MANPLLRNRVTQVNPLLIPHLKGLDRDWFSGFWSDFEESDDSCGHFVNPPSLSDEDRTNINVLELFPVLEGVKRLKSKFAGFKVIMVVDNLQVLYMIKTGRSANKTCMRWLRELFWICSTEDIELDSEYISSSEYIIADSLSRLAYDNVSSNVIKLIGDANLCYQLKVINFCRSKTHVTTTEMRQASESSPRSLNPPCKKHTVELLS